MSVFQIEMMVIEITARSKLRPIYLYGVNVEKSFSQWIIKINC